MVQLLVHFATFPFLVECVRIYSSCFNFELFRRNVSTSPGPSAVILMSSQHVSSECTLFFLGW